MDKWVNGRADAVAGGLQGFPIKHRRYVLQMNFFAQPSWRCRVPAPTGRALGW
jgi:hypothetical protein